MSYRKICSKNFLKAIQNPSKMRPLNFEKKVLQVAYWVFTKKIQIFSQDFPRTFWNIVDFIQVKSNKNQSISCNNSGVITNGIEHKSLTKARKSTKKKTLLFLNKILQMFFFLSSFLPLLPVLPPFFSPLLPFVRTFLKLPGHVCY